MAREEKKIADTEEENAEAEAAPRRGKRLLLVIVLLLLLIGAVGGGLYFSGMLGKDAAQEEAAAPPVGEAEKAAEKKAADGHGAEVKTADAAPVFYAMPEFLINLNTGGKGTSFLKMSISLELPSKDMEAKVKAIEPRIVDSLNTYLREMRAGDLSGSAGLYRLREELLMRINKALQPEQVNDVLFKEIIVQ